MLWTRGRLDGIYAVCDLEELGKTPRIGSMFFGAAPPPRLRFGRRMLYFASVNFGSTFILCFGGPHLGLVKRSDTPEIPGAVNTTSNPRLLRRFPQDRKILLTLTRVCLLKKALLVERPAGRPSKAKTMTMTPLVFTSRHPPSSSPADAAATGEIPVEINNLLELEHLDLAVNYLTGGCVCVRGHVCESPPVCVCSHLSHK